MEDVEKYAKIIDKYTEYLIQSRKDAKDALKCEVTKEVEKDKEALEDEKD